MSLRALLYVCFLICDLTPRTSLVGHRSTAAHLRQQDRGTAAADDSGGGDVPGITAPGCGHEAEKGACSRTHFLNLISSSPAPHLYSCRTQEYDRRTTVEAADATSRL